MVLQCSLNNVHPSSKSTPLFFPVAHHTSAMLLILFRDQQRNKFEWKADRLFVMALKSEIWFYYYQTTVCDWHKVDNAFFFNPSIYSED